MHNLRNRLIRILGVWIRIYFYIRGLVISESSSFVL